MKKLSSRGIVAFATSFVLSVSALVASPSIAEARSMGFWAGHPLDGTSRSCFSENAGGTKYTAGPGCPGSGRWELPVPLDTNGAVTFSVRAKGVDNDVNGVRCQAFGVNNMDQLATSTPVQTRLAPTFATLTLSLPSVPSGGHAIVVCTFNGGAEVGSVNF
jgi:hypothetical protein